MSEAAHPLAAAARLLPSVLERLEALRDRIERAGRSPDSVEVVAVTKGFGPEACLAAIGAGLRSLGENYAGELVAKAASVAAALGDAEAPGLIGPEAVARGAEWHFLGRLQRNKIGRLAGLVGCFETLSRKEEAVALARHAPGAPVFVEVELTGLPGRNGCSPADAPAVVAAARELGLEVRGLMTVAAPGGGERARTVFATVARLAAELSLGELSMGMSEDLEEALAEGATTVRVGTALFGPRPERGRLPQ